LSTYIYEKNCLFVGRRLQEERKTHGFVNRVALGNALEKSDRTITNWESGNSYPDAVDLLKLADMGLDVGYILFGIRQTLVADQVAAENRTPAAGIGAEIAGLSLSKGDAEMVLELAKRLAKQ
jgi:transcriptional regulator with XRE-family HTH domain